MMIQECSNKEFSNEEWRDVAFPLRYCDLNPQMNLVFMTITKVFTVPIFVNGVFLFHFLYLISSMQRGVTHIGSDL
jgi:hypothetical protein